MTLEQEVTLLRAALWAIATIRDSELIDDECLDVAVNIAITTLKEINHEQ